MRIILDHDTGVVLPPREGEGGPARPREYIETRIESRTGCNQDLISKVLLPKKKGKKRVLRPPNFKGVLLEGQKTLQHCQIGF